MIELCLAIFFSHSVFLWTFPDSKKKYVHACLKPRQSTRDANLKKNQNTGELDQILKNSSNTQKIQKIGQNMCEKCILWASFVLSGRFVDSYRDLVCIWEKLVHLYKSMEGQKSNQLCS